jgi:hypothetical protein
MKKIISLVLCTGLSICVFPVNATSFCMEGYDNGTNCTIFDRDKAPRAEGLGPTVQFGPDYGTPDNYYSYYDGAIYYTPVTVNTSSAYPYDDYDLATGKPSSGADEPNFWCNITNSDMFSSPTIDGDYGWAYTETPGLCNVMSLLKNSADAVLSSTGKFGSSYSYGWAGNYHRMTAPHATPSSGVDFGIAQSKIYRVDGVSTAAVEKMFSAIAASGVSVIRIPMGSVPSSSTDTSVADFENLVGVVQIAKNNGLDVVIGLNEFQNINLPIYYDDSSTDGSEDYAEEFAAECWGGGTRKVTDWNNSTYTYQTYLSNALQRFVNANLDNIIGIEVGNEIDTVCYNADIPYDGDNEPSMGGSEFSNSAAAYGALLIKSRDAIDGVYGNSGNNPYSYATPKLVTYGMTFAYRSWHVKCDTAAPYSAPYASPYTLPIWCPNYDAANPHTPLNVPLQSAAWDSVKYLANALLFQEASPGTRKAGDVVDVIGYHFYSSTDVDGELEDIYYPGINPVSSSYPGFPSGANSYFSDQSDGKFIDNVWLTEWGFQKKGSWPNPAPFYDKNVRYRAMVEMMEHLNTDSDASKIKKAFLYSFYSTDKYEIGQLDLSGGVARFNMPESRVVKLYASAIAANCSGAAGWTNPCDSDSDGIKDADELTAGTNPLLEDTDGDSMTDSDENTLGTDPLNRLDPVRAILSVQYLVGLDDVDYASSSNTRYGLWSSSAFSDSAAADKKIEGFVGPSGTYGCSFISGVVNCGNGTLADVVKIQSAGGHSCVLFKNNTVKCWGGSSVASAVAPTLAGLGHPIVDFSIHDGTSDGVGCAVDASVNYRCWDNDGSYTATTPFTTYNSPAPALSSLTAVAVGTHHVCFINAGYVHCRVTGSTYSAQLGDSDNDGYVDISGTEITNARKIVAGDDFTCALRGAYETGSGQVTCWGSGAPTVSGLSKPVSVTALTGRLCVVDAGVTDHDNLFNAIKCFPDLDSDSDSTVDGSDSDDDNDGVSDTTEATNGTVRVMADTDGDDYCDGSGSACSGMSGNNDADPLDPGVH